MKILCMGGGPAGLYFAISMKLRDPSHQITVLERNKANDTFGWGVVLSDDALGRMQKNDPVSTEAIRSNFAYWDDIAVIHDGVRTVSGGHGFAGIGRKQMLILLQQRARELGVDLRFESVFRSAEEYRREYDLVVGCDGINSVVRAEYADVFKPDIDTRLCKFIWLGTHQKFDDAFTFIFERTEHGWIWAHVYQFDDNTATFIVETLPETWEKLGFADMSKEESVETCRRIFERHLGGHELMSNAAHLRGSAVWIQFPRVICEHWYHENVVLMGDAAATGHFSIGSGTRLAFDSAIALAEYLHSEPTMEAAFARYQEERRLEVLRLQSAARNSLEWFEQVERYLDMEPTQFAYSLLTRSQRISHENLRLRDPEWLQAAEDWFQSRAGGEKGRRPMFAPFRLREMTLKNRIVMSPMAQYKAVDGCPTDWHFCHYAERAKGGAALIYTEMTCVSPEGRITPGCPGLYAPEHEAAWKRLADFIHAETTARFCMQIGHSGRKGSTCVPWDGGIDAPLAQNWQIMAPSAIPYKPGNAVPKAMDRADMDMVRDQFVEAARMAERIGADMIELHAAHGYLIASFISPITNHRDDEYGGSLENRMRYPLEVFAAMRAVWPEHKPMSVRISANDWIDGGVTPEEAVQIARMFREAGADIIDVSSGQTDPAERPVYGRMFQTPFSDRIRNEAGIATMTVGNISDYDQVNGILMAGRADLVCLARMHLADPYWTLHAAVEQGDTQSEWPVPYKGGRDLLFRLRQRQQEAIRA
ncbi:MULTISPECIES: bifunctional salicylyl-CoA 5-hydroxylase/oxidoreductase [unclassified Paracoccus (in: a-proteobacteria)]|uniref:bifunctional salicylyl-CoA 5-hydroxylase/oxidoreductase n=1 Tax=unclassified Paracoccus (in: a-proteobacteria) TaxID=2688777 RepID=UPI0012B31244|nr:MULTISPECIES: bifunctional salicylyl-CoA 5-hydroxylase/oxidoreductase [unclassified Paracoccus (in: a-proteobacteria)]UXU74277.1 bifunctional salicylyl-CoA 5-hydroxylase/oxidoreductase [Paracoccus sp. SMMA_5]UXU80168.1 bifunctional salicylyl-CoA 5-hydroxylase/oxidoreductase [Paracoccus sp. SMMA_5_TC]